MFLSLLIFFIFYFFLFFFLFFFFNDTATTEIYTLSLHDALPIYENRRHIDDPEDDLPSRDFHRSEEHTSELQSRLHLVCRLLLEKKKYNNSKIWRLDKIEQLKRFEMQDYGL